jgi:DNA topoisomerase-1
VPEAAVSHSPADPASCPPARETAEAAGLRYVTDQRPGITRRRSGRGFRYVAPDATTVTDPAEKARFAALAVPPAWTDVWICPDPDGHVQATGRDKRGRKQYRYHPRWREVRDADKFDRVLTFGAHLPQLRAQVAEDLAGSGLHRDRVLALVVRLLDETLIRVGNPEYAADNDTFGLTTLRHQHVDISSRRIVFEFVGKGGIDHRVRVEDARLARLVRRCDELRGQDLFTYVDEDGALVDVTSCDVNAYVRRIVGLESSAKDFRTWGGTVIATETLATCPPPATRREADGALLAAYDAAAAALRNTRTVCRQCYVHPAVPEAFTAGTLVERWRAARGTTHHRRAERATLAVLTAAADDGVGTAAAA